MEEERKDCRQKPWCDAGFKTEDDWLDWWVSALERSMVETQNALQKMRHEKWESESQLAKFINHLCTYRGNILASVRVVLVDPSNQFDKDTIFGNVFALCLIGCDNKFYSRFQTKNFLLSCFGNCKWYEITRKADRQIAEILVVAKRIRRNILYPEVEEMERKIMGLESRVMHLQELLNSSYKHLDELRDELAEKQGRLDLLKKWKMTIMKDMLDWHKRTRSIAQTRSIFKSKTIAIIREDAEELGSRILVNIDL